MPYSDPERQRAYQREWMASRRADWIAEHGPCVDCHTWDDLQVDHVDASSKVTHRVWSWSKTRRDTELAKCVVRCDPCHKVKTVAAGERALGERNGQARLTQAASREILASSLGHRELGRIYRVDEKTVRSVRNGTTWQRVI